MPIVTATIPRCHFKWSFWNVEGISE